MRKHAPWITLAVLSCLGAGTVMMLRPGPHASERPQPSEEVVIAEAVVTAQTSLPRSPDRPTVPAVPVPVSSRYIAPRTTENAPVENDPITQYRPEAKNTAVGVVGTPDESRIPATPDDRDQVVGEMEPDTSPPPPVLSPSTTIAPPTTSASPVTNVPVTTTPPTVPPTAPPVVTTPPTTLPPVTTTLPVVTTPPTVPPTTPPVVTTPPTTLPPVTEPEVTIYFIDSRVILEGGQWRGWGRQCWVPPNEQAVVDDPYNAWCQGPDLLDDFTVGFVIDFDNGDRHEGTANVGMNSSTTVSVPHGWGVVYSVTRVDDRILRHARFVRTS